MDHSAGRTDAELRRLIDEADASGSDAWDASAVRAEVLRRYAARTAAQIRNNARQDGRRD